MPFAPRNKKVLVSLTAQLEDIQTKLNELWEHESGRFEEMSEATQESDKGYALRQGLGTIEAAAGTLEEVVEALGELKDL